MAKRRAESRAEPGIYALASECTASSKVAAVTWSTCYPTPTVAILRTCVFPCAGFGTRFFPATKVIPKEMLPLVDKPILQYGVEEARDSGLDKLIIVTSKGKDSILDHFDGKSELERAL